jgi:hypothetical protein
MINSRVRKWMVCRSGPHCLKRVEGFISCLESQSLLHLLLHELHVLQQVGVALYTLPTGNLDDLDAVVTAVDTGSNTEGTAEETILEALDAVVEGGPGLSHLAVNADGGAESPAAGVAVEGS